MSWEQLASIYAEQDQAAAAEAAATPVGCPHDGMPLESVDGGGVHCRFCGWEG